MSRDVAIFIVALPVLAVIANYGAFAGIVAALVFTASLALLYPMLAGIIILFGRLWRR
jgi:hypothetical protein